MRRRKGHYFDRIQGDPEPLTVDIRRRVRFSEVDALRIVWHGRYPSYFEEGSEELGRLCGLTYKDFFDAGLRAPVVALHIDYFKPLLLGEEFIIRAAFIWNRASRINTEYYLLKDDGSLATSGYTVQLLTHARTGEACMVSPALLERCRERWKDGAFHGGKGCP